MKQGFILIIILTATYMVGELAGVVALITFLAVSYSGTWLTNKILGPYPHSPGDPNPHILLYTIAALVGLLLANVVQYLLAH